MARKIFVPILLLITALGLNSCFNDSSSDSVSTNSDCAITAVTMGTLIRTVYTTTTAGNDTSYQISVAGAAYPMYVDQLKLEIYNPDSLPVNTNIRKVILSSITADGSLFYRTAGGTDTLFTTTDTLDFSQPKLFTCYSTDGMQSKTYKVTVNVHNSYSEDFSWSTLADGAAALSGLSAQKAFMNNDKLVVFAIKNGQPEVLQADVTSPDQWTATEISELSSFVPSGVQQLGNYFYFANNGTLMQSADGISWAEVPTGLNIELLIAAGKNSLHALADNSIYVSTDGATWEEDAVDGNLADFPSEDQTSVWSNMAFNSNFSYILACGKSAGKTSVWKKIVDANGSNTEPWSQFPQGENGKNAYPALQQSVMLAYDSKVLCAGIDDGTLSNLYLSSDGGRTWIEQTSNYNLPSGLEAESFSMFVDKDNYIWVFCSPSGKVLKGRLNRLAYATNQQVFNN